MDIIPVEQQRRSIRVGVDACVELISVVQTISHYRDILPFLLNVALFPSAGDVGDHFTSYPL